MWVALALERSDEYTGWRTCLSLQGREPQEAASGARPKIGGSRHAIGCRSLPKKLLRCQTQNGWHQPCYWLPFTYTEAKNAEQREQAD